jgi:cbb3-type cytochrome oxidase maturation protein
MTLTEGDWGLLAMSIAMFVIFVGFFIWGIKSGQFKNIEEPKYRMLRDNRDDKEAESRQKKKENTKDNHKGGGDAE